MRWAALSAVLFMAQSTPPMCPTGTGPDASALCVVLRVDRGRLQADSAQTVFTPSTAFAPPRLKGSVRDARQQMIRDLNTLLARLPAVFWFGLTTEETEMEAAGKLTDSKTRGLRTFAGTWGQFLTAYRAWRTDNLMRKGEGDLISTLFDLAQGPDSDWGPLQYLTEDPDPPAPPAREIDKGIIRFRVADPIGSWASSEYEVTSLTPAMSRETLLRVLEPLQGTLWRPGAIRSRVENYLTSRGIRSAVEVSKADASPKFVRVRPGERIARILFTPPSIDHSDLDRGAYHLLQDAQFREYMRKRDGVIAELPGPPKAQQVDLANLGIRMGEEPIFNLLQFQTNRSELAPLGMNLSVIPSRARPPDLQNPYVDLLLEKQSDTESGDKARSAPAPSRITPEGLVNASPAGVPPVVSAAPQSQAPILDENVPPPKNLKNWVGGGFEYLPGQGVRPLFVYQRTQLIGPSSLSIQSGTVNDKPVLFGNFFVDFVRFESLVRRVSFQLNGSTDFTLNRQFDTSVADERRTGGFVRGEVEWFHNKRGQLLKTAVEGRRATVELQVEGQPAEKANLTTLDFQGTWLLERYARSYPVTVRIQPVLRWGLGLSDTEPSFTRFGLTASYHQQLIGPTEFDVTGTAAIASESTPLYELPSLGGDQSVRGFRRDDVLAQHLWAVQPEIWTPVPGTGNAVGGPGQFLGRNVRLAFFSDFGRVSQTLGSFEGMKAGLGAGVRIRYGVAVLKLDWAKGLGDAYSTSNGGRFYFSVATTRAF